VLSSAEVHPKLYSSKGSQQYVVRLL